MARFVALTRKVKGDTCYINPDKVQMILESVQHPGSAVLVFGEPDESVTIAESPKQASSLLGMP